MMAAVGQKQTNVHPMVAVPEAIRTVIRETGRILLGGGKPDPTLVLDATASWSDILGKVLDQPVLINEPGYPPYRASIMDGYAVRTSEYQKQNQASDCDEKYNAEQWTHRVVDKVFAGDEVHPKTDITASADCPVSLPSAYYITTGAVVPDTYDCVVPIEECQVSEDKQKIRIQKNAKIQPNEWVRPIGCDLPSGSVVLPKGHVMDAVALGLLQQSGAESITIKRPIVVGVMSTGNELILGDKDDANHLGKIPDVNRPILLNLVQAFGNCVTLDLGTERDDDVKSMAKAIDNALEKCDVIITTGGISMGETDIVEQVLVEHCRGKLHFGRMNMKPGKPTTFVTISKGDRTRLIFAMPGNPVSATVCTQLLVSPCLDLLFHGVDDTILVGSPESKLRQVVDNALVHHETLARLSHDVQLDQQRPEYCRVTFQKTSSTIFEVSTTGVQRSSRLMSCRDAQGLLVLPVGSTSKERAMKGEQYTLLLLQNLRGGHQIRLKDSSHLKEKGRESRVAVVEVLPEEMKQLSSLGILCDQVKASLSGSRSGYVSIVSEKTFAGDIKELYSYLIDSNCADVIVVSCVTFEGSFRYHLDISFTLRSKLQKIGDSIALQARQGAASKDARAALFETVVGYAPEHQGAMVVCLPDLGVSGGLGNIRGLLKHALNLARGKPHNHHHTHQNHEHAKAALES